MRPEVVKSDPRKGESLKGRAWEAKDTVWTKSETKNKEVKFKALKKYLMARG